jgi:hypothetical protein
MWCIPELDDEYINRMEDLLDLYERPVTCKEPVICLDERPVQLLSDYRETIRMKKPGDFLKRDYEYVRAGSANVFCIVDPRQGKYYSKVTKNRKRKQFAKIIKYINNCYSKVKKIHLVMDNLNTHNFKSLKETYGEKEGKKIWERFSIHYTPVHGSWLNQAEIAINLISGECIGKQRIADIKDLKRRINAWNTISNRKRRRINWTFTTKKARKKFGY